MPVYVTFDQYLDYLNLVRGFTPKRKYLIHDSLIKKGMDADIYMNFTAGGTLKNAFDMDAMKRGRIHIINYEFRKALEIFKQEAQRYKNGLTKFSSSKNPSWRICVNSKRLAYFYSPHTVMTLEHILSNDADFSSLVLLEDVLEHCTKHVYDHCGMLFEQVDQVLSEIRMHVGESLYFLLLQSNLNWINYYPTSYSPFHVQFHNVLFDIMHDTVPADNPVYWYEGLNYMSCVVPENFIHPNVKNRIEWDGTYWVFVRMVAREAENRVRHELGLKQIGEGWISETILFNRICKAVQKNVVVVHHARPKFLQGQEYDIYLPGYKIAIEYQGQQHYKEVSMFGGKEGLDATLSRDAEKKRKSVDNGIRLFLVKYDDSDEKVERLIKRIAKIVGNG